MAAEHVLEKLWEDAPIANRPTPIGEVRVAGGDTDTASPGHGDTIRRAARTGFG
jgi:hypothetical protein